MSRRKLIRFGMKQAKKAARSAETELKALRAYFQVQAGGTPARHATFNYKLRGTPAKLLDRKDLSALYQGKANYSKLASKMTQQVMSKRPGYSRFIKPTKTDTPGFPRRRRRK